MKPRLAFAYDPQFTEHVFAPGQLNRLGRLCEVLQPEPLRELTSPEARAVLAETEILVTGWGPPQLDATTLQAAPKLKLIAHSAGSIKYFMTPEVVERVAVTSAVVANAVPVAEFTVAAILFANKGVLAFRDIYRREKRHLRSHPLMASRLGNYRKTIGIIGASRIGLKTLELLAPYDFELLLTSASTTPEQAAALGAELVELDQLMARSDVASLHAPALPSTRHMIDARRLALLHDGATFINTARGSIVDQDALLSELVAGRLNAVIDVTEPEVLPADSPLYDLPNVLLTPHIAGAIGGERERLGTLVVDEIERFVRGEPLLHRVPHELLGQLA